MAEKKCTKCGETKPLEKFYKFKYGRLGTQPHCKVCCDAMRRLWALAHPEQNREISRASEKRNIATKKAYRRRPERVSLARKYSSEWYSRNKERLKAVRAKWFRENYETKRKPMMVQNEANRRARKRAASGAHTLEQVTAMYQSQRGCCAACEIVLGGSFHRDHIIPLIAGGSNDIGNIQLLCPDCNRIKGPRSQDYLKAIVEKNKNGRHCEQPSQLECDGRIESTD